jgi:DNA-binding LytR/AlgR family response regulator
VSETAQRKAGAATLGDAARPSAVIAADEPLLRAQLRTRLARAWPELRVVHEMGDGRDVDAVIARHAPSLFFLDIHMPGVNGLDAARAIGSRAHVVFVTAYDDYAVEAFERGAIDYVLKPITTARLLTTVQRLKSRVGKAPPDLVSLLQNLAPRGAGTAPARHLQWINASRGAAVRLITVDEVLYFKADNKYTLVVMADSEAVIRKTIRELSEELDPTMFWQVHRSSIVNVHAIDSVVRDDRGNLNLRLKGRTEVLPVSDQYHFLFRQM